MGGGSASASCDDVTCSERAADELLFRLALQTTRPVGPRMGPRTHVVAKSIISSGSEADLKRELVVRDDSHSDDADADAEVS